MGLTTNGTRLTISDALPASELRHHSRAGTGRCGSGQLDRKFSATSRPNQVWLADLTYIPTGEGWLYMAAIMDLHTRKIVGWSMRDHLRAELATSALPMATQRQRPSASLIQHSDRGIQHACGDYQVALAKAGIIPSMSRQANPLDNPPMESFLHTLKTELVHHQAYRTRDEAKRGLFSYVEGSYNRQRLHSALDHRTPDQAEQQTSVTRPRKPWRINGRPLHGPA